MPAADFCNKIYHNRTSAESYGNLAEAVQAFADKRGWDLLMIRRREFIAGLGGAAAMWPLAARAQQPGKLPTIGFIGARGWTNLTTPFLRRLGELGWVEGRNILLEFRWKDGSPEAT